jgi:hypothetical protein
VIHLVGIISEAGTQTFENVHIRGTHNVVEAALQWIGGRPILTPRALASTAAFNAGRQER